MRVFSTFTFSPSFLAIQSVIEYMTRLALSRDDQIQGESNSIKNKKEYLEDFARKNGFRNIRHFTDHGVSGITFEREGFQKIRT